MAHTPSNLPPCGSSPGNSGGSGGYGRHDHEEHDGGDASRCPDLLTLAGYIDGMTTAEETALVERHLAACSECREAVAGVREASASPEPMPQESLDRITKAVLTALEDEKRRGALGGVSSEPRAAEAMAQAGTRDRERASIAGVAAPNRVFARTAARDRRRGTAKRVCRYGILAAAVLAAPLLAWWGVGIVWNDSPTNAIAPPPAIVNPSAASHTVSGSGENARRPSTDVDPAMPMTGGGVALDLPASFLDKEIESYATQADIEALLPHTDAEWEAWARQEFPHILWLNDVLTAHPERPPYQVPLNDNGASLVPPPNCDSEQPEPLWDGVPVGIPAQATGLHAGAPADERQVGWRTLLVYSGEIFRFDFPETMQAPMVRPSIHAMEVAAAVAGYGLQIDIAGGWALPELHYVDIDGSSGDAVVASALPDPEASSDGGMGPVLSPRHGGPITVSFHKVTGAPTWAGLAPRGDSPSDTAAGGQTISEYTARVFDNGNQASRVLIHIVAVADFMQAPIWKALGNDARILLTRINQPGNATTCRADETKAVGLDILMRYALLSRSCREEVMRGR